MKGHIDGVGSQVVGDAKSAPCESGSKNAAGAVVDAGRAVGWRRGKWWFTPDQRCMAAVRKVSKLMACGCEFWPAVKFAAHKHRRHCLVILRLARQQGLGRIGAGFAA
jgi:hypothetical protein